MKIIAGLLLLLLAAGAEAQIVTGELLYPRYGHDAVVRGDGKVLLSGGKRGALSTDPDPPPEILDTATGTSVPAQPPTLTGTFRYNSIVTLPDSRIVDAGNGNRVAIYDGKNWTRIADYNNQPQKKRIDHSTNDCGQRQFATATALPSGKVLLSGGTCDSGWSLNIRSDYQLYDPDGLPRVFVYEYSRQASPFSVHYFMASLLPDLQFLDVSADWMQVRTSTVLASGFHAYAHAWSGTSPVCRFYLPPPADSHFYSASPTECAEVKVKFPQFVFEAPDVMHVYPAPLGVCATGQVPVYRVWNQKLDSNHRYVTDRALRDSMVSQGWLAEGNGPDAVVFCVPV